MSTLSLSYKQALGIVLLCIGNIKAATPTIPLPTTPSIPPPAKIIAPTAPLSTTPATTPTQTPPPPTTGPAAPTAIVAPTPPLSVTPVAATTPPTASPTTPATIAAPATTQQATPVTTPTANVTLAAPLPVPPAITPPVTTMPTQPATVAPETPLPVPTTPTSADATQNYKVEVDEINSLLQNITRSKALMKELLASVDSDISTAKELVNDARKKSLEIMSKSTKDTAKSTDTDIQQKLTSITNLHKKIIETTTKEFQNENDKIQQSMKQITTIVEKLKVKGSAFQASEAQKRPKTNAPTEASGQKSTDLPKAWAIANDKDATKAISATQEPTMIHYFFHQIATAISKIIHIGYIFYRGCKAAIWDEQPAKDISANAGGSKSENPPTAQLPSPVPNVNPEQDKLKKYSISMLETTIAPIESVRTDMAQAASTLEQQIDQLRYRLISNKAIALAIQNDFMLFAPIQPQPAWRQTAEECFNSFLNSLTWAYQGTKQATTKAYQAYVQPIFYKVHHDIKREIDQQEHSRLKKAITDSRLPAQKG